ncbi:MAG: hypothetical protein AAGG11_14545 [Pseudomonadota bacterium]
MYRVRSKFKCSIGVLTALLLLPAIAIADLLDGELGLWLTDRVAPKLIRHVGQHPRFAGATLELVALDDQRPTAKSNELVGAIAEYLQHRLLEQSQARIAWTGTADACRRLPTATLLLGIEVTGSGGRYRVSVRGLDPEEGVWLPGVSFRWQGPLGSAERRALRQTVAQGPRGTRARPFAADDRAAIADALVAQLECLRGFTLDGSVAFAAGAADAGASASAASPRLRAMLESRLRRVPMLTLAGQADDADWLLKLQTGAETPGAAELVLVASTDTAQQRLASTFVVTPAAPRGLEPDTAPATQPAVARDERPDTAAFEPQSLLSDLSRHPGNECPKTVRPARNEYCVAVDLALEEDGYLFSFRTENGRVISNHCGRAAEHSAPGRRRFRLVLDRESTVTFYALATRDVRTAEALRRLFNERGSGCGRSRTFDRAQWLTRLDRIVGTTAAVDWRALELPESGAELLATREGG